jgi:hypothetical protein
VLDKAGPHEMVIRASAGGAASEERRTLQIGP